MLLKWEIPLDANILKRQCMGKFCSYIIPTSYSEKLHERDHLKEVSLYVSLDESFVLTVGDYWA